MGRTMPFATRYDVSTQVASSTLAERLPAIWGRETLATLVSSTSMKVASITVAAINHGFMSAFGLAKEGVIAPLPQEDGDVDVHAGPKHVACGKWIERDLHGNPLYHLDIVAGSVFGR